MISGLDPRHRLELDIARQFLTGISAELFIKHPHLRTLQEIIASQQKTPRVKLKDVCYSVKGNFPTLATPEGPYPFVVTAEERRTADTFQIEDEAVCVPLISSTGHGKASMHRIHYEKGKFALANLLFALLPKDKTELDAKFLYHALSARLETLFVPLMKGTANVSLKLEDALNVEIPLPTYEEQKRLALEVDRNRTLVHYAEAIVRAWKIEPPEVNAIKTATLGEICEITTGTLDANAATPDGAYPFFTCSRGPSRISQYAFDCPAVLLAGNNATADFNVKRFKGKFNAYQRTYVITPKNPEALHFEFVYFMVLASLPTLKQQAVGAGTKYLKLAMVSNIPIPLLDPTIQHQIVDDLTAQEEHISGVLRLRDIAEARIKRSLQRLWEN